MIRHKVDDWLAGVFPRQCFLCRQPSGDALCCPACCSDLPWVSRPCRVCGGPLPVACPGPQCARCGVDMSSIDGVVSALVYEYPVDQVIALAKFGARADAARVLGALLGRYLKARKSQNTVCLPDAMVPVPLHRLRLARRGFNQATEIARAVEDAIDLPLAGSAILRTRNTLEQTGLTGRARYRNTRGAFRATEDFSGRHVAVVDDVLTTGSTVAAVAAALREAGATQIQVWSVARTAR